MDTHDLPFKCTVPGCQKLQGFASKSWLVRHERKVHKLDDGLVTYFVCPLTDCGREFANHRERTVHIYAEHPGREQSTSEALSTTMITKTSTSLYTRATDHRQPETPKRLNYTISTDCTVSEVARNRMRFMALECGPKHRLRRSGS